MVQELDGSFRPFRSDSLLGRIVCRSHSCHMLLESSISSECVEVARYERLPRSMRSLDEPPRRQPRAGVWRLLFAQAFARKVGEIPSRTTEPVAGAAYSTAAIAGWSAEEEVMKKKKKRRWSSWLPDPDRRWPVQGW